MWLRLNKGDNKPSEANELPLHRLVEAYLSLTSTLFAPLDLSFLFFKSTDAWISLPPILGYSRSFLFYHHLVTIRRELVDWVATQGPSLTTSMSMMWCHKFGTHGVTMPNPQRSSFACTGFKAHRIVFVVDGCNKRKNALWSTLAYDVVAIVWVHLPNMA